MKKYIINMLVAIVVATASQAQVPVITTQPQSVTVCKGSTASFSVAATNSPTSYTWQMSINDGETWSVYPSFQAFQITILPPSMYKTILVRSIANNANGSSEPSAAAVLTVNKATDSLYITKPNTTTTCVGNSFMLVSSQANGAFSSSNSSVAAVNCKGIVNVKAQGTVNISYVYMATNGCTDTATYALNTNNPPAATVSGSNSVCVGVSPAYNASVTGGAWACDARMTINPTTGIASTTAAGNTSIYYTITANNGCKSTTKYPITINATPAIPDIAYGSGNTINPRIGAPAGSFCRNRSFNIIGLPSGGIFSSTGSVAVNNAGNVVIGNTTGAASISYTVNSVAGCPSKRTISFNVFACATKGISNQASTTNKELFAIYPNPAKGNINVKINKSESKTQLIITNLLGKQVHQQLLSLGTNSIDISNIAKGIYLATINIDGKIEVQKIIIE